MIISTGLDLCDIRRIEKILARSTAARFKQRYFTPAENAHIAGRQPHAQAAAYARRWAAKEAIAKALGTGFRQGLHMHQMNVLNDANGKPTVTLHGRAKELLNRLQPHAIIHIAMTDEYPYAMAQIIVSTKENSMENLPDTRMPGDEPSEPRAPKTAPVQEKRENTISSIFWAVVLAMLIRVFLFEPFNIPSTSMVPNLLIGDFLFVSKYSYGYSGKSIGYGLFDFQGRIGGHLPQRGDVAVFKLPTDPSIDYIKRVIGLPGDHIQVIHGILQINAKPVPRYSLGKLHYKDANREVDFQKYEEVLPNGVRHDIVQESDDGPLDNTDVYVVPPGHYFMMGDNRDNSQDSRVLDRVGYVPVENFVGKAEFLFFSLNDDTQAWEIWKWPFAIRYGRLFQEIH